MYLFLKDKFFKMLKDKPLNAFYILSSLLFIVFCVTLFISGNRFDKVPIDKEIYFNDTRNDVDIANISFNN